MKKIAALDIGLKRVGVAFCFDNSIVLPQNAIRVHSKEQAVRDLKKLLEEWGINKVVVGIPKGGSSEEEMSKIIKDFVKELDLDMEIDYVDESFSSYEAKELMKGKIKQKRDGRIDSIAAKIILERYLGI
ncbi:MAG: Holliday junction resolvase RuvX [Epsilonproteobacteria bacterium]|nr:Holliday junction resolvase RuvX [Campylobacterota bacterium]